MSENENFGKLSGGVPPGARSSEVFTILAKSLWNDSKNFQTSNIKAC